MQAYVYHTDDMTFLEGFYFWFITFTTVGYGDFVPGYSKNPASSHSNGHERNEALRTANIAFNITWTTLGLCVVSSVLNAVAAFIEKRSAERLRTKCCSCLHGDQEESEEIDSKDNDSYRVNNYNGSDKIGSGNGSEKIPEDENYHSVTYV